MSYALYLWHEPVLWAISEVADGLPVVLQIIVAIGLSFAASVASWHLLEQPAQRHKHRFGRSSARPTPVDRTAR